MGEIPMEPKPESEYRSDRKNGDLIWIARGWSQSPVPLRGTIVGIVSHGYGYANSAEHCCWIVELEHPLEGWKCFPVYEAAIRDFIDE